MSGVLGIVGGGFIAAGAFFFLAGTAGLLRFPDVYCRLHALTKADNLGLGLVSLGLILQGPGVAAGIQILLIWLLALVAAATVCHLLARSSLREGVHATTINSGELPVDGIDAPAGAGSRAGRMP